MARNKYDVDESLEEKFSFSQIKRLGGYLSPCKRMMNITIFLTLSSSAVTMLYPIFFKILLDSHIPDKNMNGVAVIGICTLLITLYVSISARYRIRLTDTMGQKVIYQIRSDIFNHLQELPFSYYDSRPHGKIQVRVVNYVNNLSDLLSNGIVNTITDVCSLIFILIFMFLLNRQLTLICLLGIPVASFMVFLIKNRQRKAWQSASNKMSNLNAYISESINGVRVTQSFVREGVNQDIFDGLSGKYKKSWLNAVRYNFLLGPIVDNIATITMGIIFLVGVYAIEEQKYGITLGVLVAFVGYIGRFWTPITTLANFYNSLLTAISYLERIFETIDEPVLVKNEPDASEMPDIKGSVDFKNISFSYEDGVRILDEINFTAKQGDSIAIVGPTGAGKTTIVNLISRFYNPDSGTIAIDGQDISKVTLKSLRGQMGIMMQDSFIFSGTILDNIRYGKQDATRDEVIQAARLVRAHDFIMGLEEGYDTQVNERGSRLSVGQRQLISFARALLANPKILILDEATSSIDTETEILLQEGLVRLLKDRTSFIIAHRLSTIRHCTYIMYVDKGRIMEQGTHEELMVKRGDYFRLHRAQQEA